jgi:UDP-glucose 4-epimerase
MHKNCILVGGSGFLGLNVAVGLISAGYKVTIVDKRSFCPEYFPEVTKKIDFIRMDYHGSEALKNALRGKDVLFHFASLSLPGTSMDSMDNDIRDDVLGSIKLFKLAHRAGVKKIVFPSSGGTVYGDSDQLPINEKKSTNPISSYGVIKLTIENYLFLFNKIYGMEYLIYRLSNPYGPGQNPNGEQGLITKSIYNMLTGLPITVFGNGKNLRDYMFIEDAVAAFVAGMKQDLKNDIYNVGSGKGYTINEVIKIASEVAGIKPEVKYLKKRQIDVTANILDTTKFRSETGWRAKVSLEKGIKNTYEWVKKRVS